MASKKSPKYYPRRRRRLAFMPWSSSEAGRDPAAGGAVAALTPLTADDAAPNMMNTLTTAAMNRVSRADFFWSGSVRSLQRRTAP